MASKKAPNPPAPSESSPGQILIYADAGLNLQVRLDGETVWLTQLQMADLYQTTKQNISLHVLNILEERKQDREATVKEYLTVQQVGSRQVRRLVEHYNFDMILAVGYRVRSQRGAQFRQWATTRLSELLIKGFTLDDDRIKAGRTLGQDADHHGGCSHYIHGERGLCGVRIDHGHHGDGDRERLGGRGGGRRGRQLQSNHLHAEFGVHLHHDLHAQRNAGSGNLQQRHHRQLRGEQQLRRGRRQQHARRRQSHGNGHAGQSLTDLLHYSHTDG